MLRPCPCCHGNPNAGTEAALKRVRDEHVRGRVQGGATPLTEPSRPFSSPLLSPPPPPPFTASHQAKYWPVLRPH